MSSFAENSTYFKSVNSLHNCLLSISSAAAEVERVQIKSTGPVVKVSKPGQLEFMADTAVTEQDGVNYKQLSLNGCLVVWEVAIKEAA